MNAFTIKDLENLTGIKAHTIRIWEQRYQFLKPSRTDTNIRYYSNDDLKKILNIALLNRHGFKISHIDKMSEVEIQERILTLTLAQAQQERMVNDLIQYMVDLETESFEEQLSHYIAARGIERTITQIIFPFLERIGILWVTNHINPAQEHLVSNIIRQKLILGIEGVSTALQTNKTVLLFLPEGEYHEIGLLFMYYVLRTRGIKVLYLGANVPLKDIEFVANIKKPDFLYTHVTSNANNFNFDRFLQNAHKKLGNYKIIVSGYLTKNYEKPVPEHITLKQNYTSVMEFVSSI